MTAGLQKRSTMDRSMPILNAMNNPRMIPRKTSIGDDYMRISTGADIKIMEGVRLARS